jgi:hypothetical protein
MFLPNTKVSDFTFRIAELHIESSNVQQHPSLSPLRLHPMSHVSQAHASKSAHLPLSNSFEVFLYPPPMTLEIHESHGRPHPYRSQGP